MSRENILNHHKIFYLNLSKYHYTIEPLSRLTNY